MIDRIGPTRRPNARARGYHQWRSLLFMHWPVSVETLRRLTPASLDLDLFDGVAYAGIVPFAMRGVRPRWWPNGLSFQFLETNVRIYVVHDGRPGVYFLSLEAASSLAVWTAKTFWSLPYFRADMSVARQGDVMQYHSRRRHGGVQHDVTFRIGEALAPTDPASLEFFFLERYFLFVEHAGKLHAGQVHHAPYPAHRADVLEIHDDLLTAAGLTAATNSLAATEPRAATESSLRDRPPAFAHYSPGVDVEVFDLHEV